MGKTAAGLLLNPGDGAVVETPSHPTARSIFRRLGARLLPLPVDEEGVRIGALSPLLKAGWPTPRLIYVTPSHQFPTGALLSPVRRHDLVTAAHRTGALIIEDDYDCEMHTW